MIWERKLKSYNTKQKKDCDEQFRKNTREENVVTIFKKKLISIVGIGVNNG